MLFVIIFIRAKSRAQMGVAVCMELLKDHEPQKFRNTALRHVTIVTCRRNRVFGDM